MLTLHSKNYKIFQNFGFPKMGVGGGWEGDADPHKKKCPPHMRWQKVVLRSPECIYSRKAKKISYVLDVQVARKNDV